MQALVATTLAAAAATSADIAYVAVHGTGTPLGDPIEVGALAQALTVKGGLPPAGTGRPASLALTLGSVKACFGHTEGAAGLTGEPSSCAQILSRSVERMVDREDFRFGSYLFLAVQAVCLPWQLSSRPRGHGSKLNVSTLCQP